MEDLTHKLNDLLNDPELMKQIKDLSCSFENQKNNNDEETTSGSENHDRGRESDPLPSLDGFSPDILSTISKLAPILSSMKEDDKYTSFLSSLRPLLSEQRRKKLDESSKILKLMHILPLLKNKDII